MTYRGGIFLAAMFIIARGWEHKCLSVGYWLNDSFYTLSLEYSASGK